jgi:hypothetical protein
MAEDKDVCGETFDHDEVITYKSPDGVQWECRRCGAEGFEEAETVSE